MTKEIILSSLEVACGSQIYQADYLRLCGTISQTPAELQNVSSEITLETTKEVGNVSMKTFCYYFHSLMTSFRPCSVITCPKMHLQSEKHQYLDLIHLNGNNSPNFHMCLKIV